MRSGKAPTPDHEPLKKHMERQLLESIEFDCAPTLDYSESELPLDEYIADAILQSRRDAESARRNLEKTMELLKNRKAYLMELERSVPRPK
jgi:hypothetical protein